MQPMSWDAVCSRHTSVSKRTVSNGASLSHAYDVDRCECHYKLYGSNRLSRSTCWTVRSETLLSCDIVRASPSFCFHTCNYGIIIGWYPCSSWAIFVHMCHRPYSSCPSEGLLPSSKYISVFMKWTRLTWRVFHVCYCLIRRVNIPQPFEHSWVLLSNVWFQCVVQSVASS